MSKRQQNLTIQEYSGDRVAKRAYMSMSSWDNIRGFVETAIENGQSQKRLLASLQQQNIPIKMHQLKRLLNEWGLSDRNIRQRNRKYIFETDKRLREEGKVVRGWKFGDTGQRIKDTQLVRIRESAEAEFEDVQATPGVLIPSPEDIMDHSPENSSVGVMEKLNEAPLKQFRDTIPVQDFETGYKLASKPQAGDSPADSMEVANFEIQKSSLGDPATQSSAFAEDQREAGSDVGCFPDFDQNSNFHDEYEADGYESGDTDDINSSRTGHNFASRSEGCVDEGICNLSEAVEALDHGVSESIDLMLEAESQGTSTNQPISLSPEEFASYISTKFRPDLNRWIDEGRAGAAEFKQTVDKLMSETNLPMITCERIAQRRRDFQPNIYQPSDYKMACWMLSGIGSELCHRNLVEVGPRLRESLLSRFYESIEVLCQSLGLNTHRGETPSYFLMLSPASRRKMLVGVVHIPYLFTAYGLTHFNTLMAMLAFCQLYNRYGQYLQLGSRNISAIYVQCVELVVEVLSLFETSVLLVDTLRLLMELHMKLGKLEMAAITAKRLRAVSPTRLRDLVGSTNAAFLAAKSQLSLYRQGRYGEIQELQSHIHKYMEQLDRAPPRNICTNYLAIAFVVFRSQQEIGRHAEAKKIRVWLSKRIGSDEIPSSTISDGKMIDSWIVRAACIVDIGFTYRLSGDWSRCISQLQKALHIVSLFASDLGSSFRLVLMGHVTNVMTERGLVRYTEPVLERWVRAFEARGVAEDHPLYRIFLSASGLAVFQLSLDEDSWSGSKIVPLTFSSDSQECDRFWEDLEN
ncbi:hypothetical protein TWF696_008488 [Orbilia brochopaga]|uniref:Clr5 domain-containing protein n=1 Tax=Orbilia brochopaga TaxID=3140254 RepID=A0AAV9UI35_9PEZI